MDALRTKEQFDVWLAKERREPCDKPCLNLRRSDLYDSDFRQLAKLTHIWHLDLAYTNVTDLTVLAGMSGLYGLDLFGLSPSVVATLPPLPKLCCINVERDAFMTLAGMFAQFPSLHVIRLPELRN